MADPLTAVVLAGGKGTRLRPLTDNLPKPMLPVLNRPFLDFLIERLVSVGVTKIILAVGYKPESLVDRYGRGQGFGVEIDYTVEDSPLGTSGAVRAVLPQLTETFLVLNGDVVTSVDLRSMIDEPEALRFVPDTGPSMFEIDLFPNMLRMNMQVHSYTWDGYFLDMGTAESYLAINRDFLSGKVPTWHEPASDIIEGEGASVSPSATVTGPTVHGPRSVIEDGATVEGSVLWNAVHVGRDARVRGAVIGSGVTIDAGARIDDGSILTNP